MKTKLQLPFFALYLLSLSNSYSQVGSLDLTFSTDGKVITTFYGNEEVASAIAIQSDGKIVTAGYVVNNWNAYEFAVVRYNTDGSLDNTFSSDGKVTTAFYGTDDTGTCLAIQSDGKIVVAGYVENSTGDYEIGLVRYNTDGALDTSFDTDGKVTTSIFGSDDNAYAIAIQSDGKIVIAGYAEDTNINADVINVVRYNTDGTLDTTFDTDGIATTSISGDNDTGNSIAIQSDGKIVVAGYSYASSVYQVALLRYNTDGSLDTSFDTDGIVTTSVNGSDDEASSVAVQSDGKIVVAGHTLISSSYFEFLVERYNSDGTLDTSFDTDGNVTTSFNGSYDLAFSVAVQSDGKIIACGNTTTGLGNIDLALACYNSDGSLATSFDTDGKVTASVELHTVGIPVKIQDDGQIVVAGGSVSSLGSKSFFATRFNGLSTGINDHEDMMGLMIYPNPFNNNLNITPASTITQEKFEIRIKDVLGKSVLAASYDNLPIEGISLNLENLTNGIYFLEIHSNQHVVSQKIIKE